MSLSSVSPSSSPTMAALLHHGQSTPQIPQRLHRGGWKATNDVYKLGSPFCPRQNPSGQRWRRQQLRELNSSFEERLNNAAAKRREHGHEQRHHATHAISSALSPLPPLQNSLPLLACLVPLPIPPASLPLPSPLPLASLSLSLTSLPLSLPLSIPLPSLPLVKPTDDWGMWAVLLCAAAAGLWSERTEWGKALSGPLVATLLGLLASNIGLVACDAPQYSVVNKFLLPLAVPLLLLGADLRKVLRDTGRLLGAFCLGSVGTIIGTLVAFLLLPLTSLGDDRWKIVAALMSRHIGGAINYVAVSEALETSPSIVASGLAADNLICAIYFASIFAIAAGIPPDPPASQPAAAVAAVGEDAAAGQGEKGPVAPSMGEEASQKVVKSTTALALSACLCWGGVTLAKWLNFTGGGIPCITALVVLLATVAPSVVGSLRSTGEEIAAVLMQVFFASVGANGSISLVMSSAPSLFLFSLLQIAIHLAITIFSGKLLGFELRELLLASNANVGGPTTAAGMATSKGWKSLLLPSILVGVFGYTIATFLSVALGYSVLSKM